MTNGSQEQLLQHISLTARSMARLLDQAEPEDEKEMEAVSVVCCQSLKHIAFLCDQGGSDEQ